MSYIELKGKKYPYYLSRRKMRSMSATVRGGVIEVHAPYHVETSVVEAFLKKHEEKFVKAIEAFNTVWVETYKIDIPDSAKPKQKKHNKKGGKHNENKL